MKRFLSFAIGLVIFAACSEEQVESVIIEEPVVPEAVKESAREDFSAILSKALSADGNLRAFIKENALEQFDMDYDVFYPYVKNQTVYDNKTFRDILLQYSDDASRFEEIEKELPLLTILVPDWSYVGCFSIHKWDTSSPAVAVGFETSAEQMPVYAEGEVVGHLSGEGFPDFPMLIVKDSDRLKQSGASTKSADGECAYEFLDEAFDASMHPQTRVQHIYSDEPIDGPQDVSEFVPVEEVPAILIEAYNKFLNAPQAAHRDYIYFGITPDQPVGKVNTHVKEYIYKLKFKNFSGSGFLSDGDDFTARNLRWEYKQNDALKTPQQLRDIFYYDGNIELKLDIIVPRKDKSTFSTTKIITANFGDVFSIDHAALDYRHRTLFCRDWYIYTINDTYIHPRWFTVNVDIPRWSIDSDSDVITMHIEEIDPADTTNREIVIKYSESTVTKVGGNVSAGEVVSGNISVDHTHSSSNERTETVNVKTTKGSDDLGNIELNFIDPVISSKGIKDGKSGYYINSVSSGVVDLMIMPKEI